MAKTKAQIIAEAQVVKNATEVGENTATRVGGVLEDLADADSVVIIPVTGTSSGGSITLSSNPFTQVQTAVNAGQHAIVRVTIGNDVVDFSMNVYSDSVSTYIGASKFLQQEFQMICTSSGTVIESINTSNTFSTGESVPNVGIDDVPTQGSDNLVKSGGVFDHTIEAVGETENLTIEVFNDNAITLKRKYTSIDDVAYESLTFKQIFETNNQLDIGAGFDSESYSPLIISAGSPSITQEDCYTPYYSVKCFGSSSQQFKTSRYVGNTFLLAKVKCTRYSSGKLGINNGYEYAYVDHVTDGWVTVASQKTTTTLNIAYVGSMSSADLDGYIDSPVIVPFSIFSSVPSVAEIRKLYDIYVELKKGQATETIIPTGNVVGANIEDLQLNIENSDLILTKKVYENFSLTDIFDRHNLLGISVGFSDGSYSPLEVSAGSPSITTDDSYLNGYSLKCAGSSSQQIRTSSTYTGTYFVAAMVNCTRYSAGRIGITLSTRDTASASAITSGWEMKAAMQTMESASRFYIGSFSSADLEGYVDMPVAIDMSIFHIPPTLTQMRSWYQQWLSIVGGTTEEIRYNIPYKNISYDDGECRNAFVSKMNEMATLFGMTNTNFVNASGIYNADHYSCARDMAKLCYCCTANDKLMWYWGQESYNVPVTNSEGEVRYLTGSSTYKGSAMTSVGDYYHIFGGKSGTWTLNGVVNRNLALCVKSKVDGEWLVGCIIKSSVNDRGVPFRQLLDWLEDYRVDPSVATPTLSCSYASAFVVPSHNPMAYQDVTLEMVGKDSTTRYLPASMTKMMTAYLATQYLGLDEVVTYKASDIVGGSGDALYEGDKIKVSDAILEMLLPSSNTTAMMFARVVGERILQEST